MEIEAIYDRGTLKLARELPLQNGQKVTIVIQPHGSAVARLCGLIPWSGNREELERYLNDVDEGVLGSHDDR